jgi:hypothetical protein
MPECLVSRLMAKGRLCLISSSRSATQIIRSGSPVSHFMSPHEELTGKEQENLNLEKQRDVKKWKTNSPKRDYEQQEQNKRL